MISLTGIEEAERQLIGNSYIALRVDNDFHCKTLLFSQKTFQYVTSIDDRHLKALTNVKQDVQYFGASGFDDWMSDILVFRGESIEQFSIEEIYEKCKDLGVFTSDLSDL
jgi:hypothetical protein